LIEAALCSLWEFDFLDYFVEYFHDFAIGCCPSHGKEIERAETESDKDVSSNQEMIKQKTRGANADHDYRVIR
jgi:hypothetical protein